MGYSACTSTVCCHCLASRCCSWTPSAASSRLAFRLDLGKTRQAIAHCTFPTSYLPPHIISSTPSRLTPHASRRQQQQRRHDRARELLTLPLNSTRPHRPRPHINTKDEIRARARSWSSPQSGPKGQRATNCLQVVVYRRSPSSHDYHRPTWLIPTRISRVVVVRRHFQALPPPLPTAQRGDQPSNPEALPPLTDLGNTVPGSSIVHPFASSHDPFCGSPLVTRLLTCLLHHGRRLL